SVQSVFEGPLLLGAATAGHRQGHRILPAGDRQGPGPSIGARGPGGFLRYTCFMGEWHIEPVQAMAKAKLAASKALELDSRLAEPYATLAYRTTHLDWDWTTAEAQYQRALELNPNYAV